MNVYLDPPQPNMSVRHITSRGIFTTWTIDEISYIQSFDIFENGTAIDNLNKSNFSSNDTQFFYNYTKNIEPARRQVKFNCSYSSEDIFVLF
jgi:hypothetical protein